MFFKGKNKLITISLIAIASFTFYKGSDIHKKRTDGFSLSRIQYDGSYNEQYTAPELSLEDNRELASALKQSYTYLAMGGQCFAFVSSDDKYVIKFFKQKHRGVAALSKLALPSFIKKKLMVKLAERDYRRSKEFISYMIAERDLKEESGLIFTHLNPTKTLQVDLKVKDKAGREHLISLDDHPFLLQKKAALIQPQLSSFMKEGKEESAKALIKNIAHFFAVRGSKGIYDDDARIHRNFGCVGEKPILIDIGRLRRESFSSDRSRMASDIIKVNHHFIEWLDEHYPTLKEEFDSQLAALSDEELSAEG